MYTVCMHKNGASEVPRTHFRARKSSKFSGGVPPDPLLQSMLWAPHFVFALGPSHPLGGPDYLGVTMQDNLSSCTSSTPCSIFCAGLTQSMLSCMLCCFSSVARSVTLIRLTILCFSPPLFVESFSFASHFKTQCWNITDP